MAATMSRPQIGIDRLPTRRLSDAPKESMNCKSCRKRKIKCNRLRPTCEACQVFQCPCIYDAVPKKRGPKTDVLEALLKRVDGLEKRLQEEKKQDGASLTDGGVAEESNGSPDGTSPTAPQRPLLDLQTTQLPPAPIDTSAILSPTSPPIPNQTPYLEILMDTYFARVHGKPYHILDELAVRQKVQTNQLPDFLANSICAVSARYAPQLGGYNAVVRMGLEFARRSRLELDIDEPTIETLQALLLLSQAYYQLGKGKRSYMLLTSGINMAIALNLHRELPASYGVTPQEREARRKLFWACYLLDRFSACGSKRPSLIADDAIVLRMPSWTMQPSGVHIEGDFFPNGSNIQYMSGGGRQGQGAAAMLIGIVRILGLTNRYLAAGGVKGDSHFPWHSLSNLSKIRHELDIWASETQDAFTTIDALFGQLDSTVLVLSKLIYHLVHVLVLRPFLPIDLAELSGSGQHQSWQIEATNLCFLHANAIAELVEFGKQSSITDWPEFVGYCICTAGTVHVHGAHYRAREGGVFQSSPEFLSRGMQQLSELRYAWSGVQHQRDTLQAIYNCHTELIKSLASNPTRFQAVFHLEDFFDRYPGHYFDGSHINFVDVDVEALRESASGYPREQPLYTPTLPPSAGYMQQAFFVPQQGPIPSQPPRKKRRSTGTSVRPGALHSPALTSPHGPIPEIPQLNTSMPQPLRLHDTHMQSDFGPDSPFTPFTPTFTFTGLEPHQLHEPTSAHFDPSLSIPTPRPQYEHHMDAHMEAMEHKQTTQQPTPTASASAHTDLDIDLEKDPFMSLLEQLAENEHNQNGPSELDCFLSASDA